jgi:hypothetical protein
MVPKQLVITSFFFIFFKRKKGLEALLKKGRLYFLTLRRRYYPLIHHAVGYSPLEQ